jgi:hypothetical protein
LPEPKTFGTERFHSNRTTNRADERERERWRISVQREA